MLAAGLLSATVLLTSCADEGGEAVADCRVDVDTPELRDLKAAAGIEDCPTGAAGANDLPDVEIPCLGGGTSGSLSAIEGPAVVNFWASNCGPCRKEMPALGEFDRQYGDQVTVVGVDFLETYPEAAIDLAQRSEATYPSFADPCGALQEDGLAVTALPVFAFVTEDGSIQLVAEGGVDSVEQIVELAETHLDLDLERSRA